MSHVEVEWYGPRVIKQVNNAVEAAMMSAVLMVEADAKRLCPVSSGRLRASITHQVRQITRDIIEGRVGSNLSYAKYVETGTRPHFPPPEALATWAKRHGMEGQEYAIAKKIAKKGTPAQPYLRPALEKNFPKIVTMIRAALRSAS